MFAPRTVKILTALFFAMTVGTLVLTWMDVEPIRERDPRLAAIAAGEEAPLPAVTRTESPLSSSRWRSVVIHSSAEGPSAVARCHFVVEPSSAGDSLNVRANGAWLSQTDSAHVPASAVPASSIGVCLMGDFKEAAPSPEQWQSLVKLVLDLQRQFKIDRSAVYLYRTISERKSPGAAFPEKEFNESLLVIKK